MISRPIFGLGLGLLWAGLDAMAPKCSANYLTKMLKWSLLSVFVQYYRFYHTDLLLTTVLTDVIPLPVYNFVCFNGNFILCPIDWLHWSRFRSRGFWSRSRKTWSVSVSVSVSLSYGLINIPVDPTHGASHRFKSRQKTTKNKLKLKECTF